MKLTTTLDAFITAKIAGNRSPRTIEKYQDIVGRFIETVGDIDLNELEPGHIETWLANHRRTGKTAESLLTYYAALSAWLTWCERRYKTRNPIGDVDRPRVAQRLPPYLSRLEVQSLLRGTHNMVNRIKAEALLRFMLDTGARAGEVCGALRQNIDLANTQARLLGKDQAERAVPLGRKTVLAIRRYWNGRNDNLPYAFHALDGPFTVSGIRSVVRRAARYGGLERNVYPHLLRHTFAYNWIAGGGDLESLRRLLGHSSLQTTQRYSGMAIEDIREKHARIRPCDKF